MIPNSEMVTVYHVNAFTKNGNGGNPAGVCLDTAGLSEQQMQAIATQVGFSETAFVLPSMKAHYRLRFFTPANEVNLCGHATIAAFHLLALQGAIKPGTYKQETMDGVLDVTVKYGSLIYMKQNPVFVGTVSKETILDALNISLDKLVGRLPIEIISTGEPTMIVPVVSLDALLGLNPDFNAIKQLQLRADKSLIYAFTTQTRNSSSTAHGRMFAPVDGINEESATGVASGAAACYLHRHQLIKKYDRLLFEQGYSLGRPSEILGSLNVQLGEVKSVLIGGRSVLERKMEVLI